MDEQLKNETKEDGNQAVSVKPKRNILKKILIAASFLAVLIAGIILINDILRKKWHFSAHAAQQVVQGFYQEKDHTLDVVCLGPSSVRNSISGLEMYKEYGFTTYSRGTSIQLPMLSYYLLQETLEKHDIKAVVMDSMSLTNIMLSGYSKEGIVGQIHEAVDYMPWSTYKYQFIQELLKQDLPVSFADFILPLYVYHDRWEEVNEEDFTYREWQADYCYKGQNPNIKTVTHVFDADYMTEDDKEEESIWIEDDFREYYEKIIQLCNERGIKFVLIKIPSDSWTIENHNIIQQFADENKIDFIDYNSLDIQKEIAFNPLTDYCDATGHLNVDGANKISRYLGAYLSEHCEFTDKRGDEAYASWDEDYEKYENLVNAAALRRESNLIAFLKKLDNPDYIVMMATRDNLSTYYNKTIEKVFRDLGIDKPFGESRYYSYAAVIDGGKVVCEAVDENPDDEDPSASCDIELDGHKISINSVSARTSNAVTIIFDGDQLAANARGFNFVVYDKKTNQVIANSVYNTGLRGREYQLPSTFELSYLDLLDNDDYITVIGAGRNGSKYMPAFVNEQLKEMGLKPLDGETNRPYLAVMNGSNIILNEYGEEDDELEFDEKVEGIQVTAACDSDVFSARIGEEPMKHKMSGLTILVYSKEKGALAVKSRFAWADNYATGTDYNDMSDIQKVLSAAKKDEADILCLYSPEQASDGVPEDVISALKEYGLGGLNTEGYYAGIAAGDGTVREQQDAQPVTMEYAREAESGKDGESIPAVSLILNPTNKGYKVLVNGITYSTKGQGLYLMIYHREKQAVLAEKNFSN
ncbi:MAG: hypothetical protein IKE15_09575 [Clostridia bacterium]|nr:hypothetical protein [Clostridia bacterium]